MPLGNETTEGLLRIFSYGKPKTKKTWWAMNAAEAGFNVCLLDGDSGSSIITQVKKEIRQRIRIIKCADKLTKPMFASLLVKLIAGYTIRWDDTAEKVLLAGEQTAPSHAYFILDLVKLTPNDVLVIDSWSSLCTSLMWQWHLDNGIDMSVGSSGDNWDLYRYENRMLNWMLVAFKGLPCHLVVVGHEQINELTAPKKNEKTGKMERVATGEVQTQATSSSKNHGTLLSKDFTDILYFNMHGATTYIDSKAKEGQDGGSRHVFAEDAWEKFQFSRIAEVIGAKAIPDADMPGCLYVKPGEAIPSGAVLASSNGAAAVKPASLSFGNPTKPSGSPVLNIKIAGNGPAATEGK